MMSLLKWALGLLEQASWMHPTSSIGEILAHMCIRCMAIPTPHIISIIWLSLTYDYPHWCEPFTVFDFLPHHFILFAILSVNSRAYAHPLHECSKYRRGVDQIELYLASGLGMSQDKIPKKTKCETLEDWVLNKNTFSRIPYPPSCTQTPFGDIRVMDSESSCTFMFLCCLFQC